MAKRVRSKDLCYLLWRRNERGYIERVVYTGSLRHKPKGWRVETSLGRVMAAESGVV